jgi:UDP-N-acetylmuramoyl-L-alanyl-D-glutamate--2,6-diaminopimelate ligase
MKIDTRRFLALAQEGDRRHVPPFWRRSMFTVAVTGTNGKTSTTHWLAAALAKADERAVLSSTLGEWIGEEPWVGPDTHADFLRMMQTALERGVKNAALEVTSQALARGYAEAWPVDVAIFTNLTHDHLDAHNSAEEYLAAKAQLFRYLPPKGGAVLNAADPASALIARVLPRGVKPIYYYGASSRGRPVHAPDLEATAIAVSDAGTRIAIRGGKKLPPLPKELFVRTIGEVFAENALAAFAGAIVSGLEPAIAAEALAEAPVPAGRFQLIARDPHVAIDYAHSPDAIARTIATGRAIARGKVTIVFGAGGDRDRTKRTPMGTAARAADRVILTSDNPRSEDPAEIARQIAAGLAGHASVETIVDRERAIAEAIAASHAGDVVIVAGKGHETEQIIGGEKFHFSDAEVVLRCAG